MQGITWRTGFTLAILAVLAFVGPRVLPEGNDLAPGVSQAAERAGITGYRAGQAPLNADLVEPRPDGRRALSGASPVPRATASPALLFVGSARGEVPIWR